MLQQILDIGGVKQLQKGFQCRGLCVVVWLWETGDLEKEDGIDETDSEELDVVESWSAQNPLSYAQSLPCLPSFVVHQIACTCACILGDCANFSLP